MELRRGVDPALLASLSRGGFPVLFVHMDWPGAPVWCHSGVGTIDWGGRRWSGVAGVGAVDIPAEGGEIAALEAMLSLAGVPADLDGFGDDAIRGRTVALYLGGVAGRPGGHDGRQASGPGATLIGQPVSLFSGTMDALTLTTSRTDEGVEHEAQVAVATGVEARSMASIFHSDEDQRRFHPADTAGRLVVLSFARAQKMTWPES